MQYTTEDVRVCTEYLTTYGSNYITATRLLPPSLRDATTILYAFVRYADEIIDNPTSNAPLQELRTWQASWHATYHHNKTHHPILDAMARVMRTYDIPYELTHDFLESMISDDTVTRYATYADLESYMWGSAAVVGLMMAHIIGVVDHDTPYRSHAIALGQAMQLTNFIRDISEDYHDRGRVYIPKEWLDAYGLDETWIAEKNMTPASRELVQMMCAKAQELFTYGNAGISYLNPHGRNAVTFASIVYSHILTNIKKNDYNIFIRSNNSRLDILRLYIVHHIRTLCRL
ncbi:MAG: phytoene/squalene synthase family protein [Candidatus Pacebacteria bacterium]|nr:phytoene/squalene synthase family protein [Candidatus Paceibacterota bacterium]MCD8508311.1 phytoene/squalene synthase family protein [Candidatus Paceibacterota bacterium]MCD8563914.1 phytoene/squalene synthase family protein [Candidatus Paceibacterota bacterium]